MKDTSPLHKSPALIVFIAVLSVLLLSSLGWAVLCLYHLLCPPSRQSAAAITTIATPRTPDLERSISHKSQSSGVSSVFSRPPTPAVDHDDDYYGAAFEMRDWRFARHLAPGSTGTDAESGGRESRDGGGGDSPRPSSRRPSPPGCCHGQGAASVSYSFEEPVGIAVTTGCADVEHMPHKREQQQQHQAADNDPGPGSGHWWAGEPSWPLLRPGEILITERPPVADAIDDEEEKEEEEEEEKAAGHSKDPGQGTAAAAAAATTSSHDSSSEPIPTSSPGREGRVSSSTQQPHHSTALSHPGQDAPVVTDWEESSAGGLTPTSSEAGSFGSGPHGQTRTLEGRALSLGSMVVVAGGGMRFGSDGVARRLTWSG
ncbi:hypothetical protein M406DRAFT_69019 [Cryphonectria parasitica EP155]|uniref:Uncharacterized protein n=1 Tax=Cryphonectria parasitica (strain ATCC 38755 / EP155) TaxID=660469 RepID=A0A9P4Y4M1_CRYP1|nr:uncharacterized protein M406DRAFT_69019 [Cryphonectria parasitica EP155]KAF3766837.1 hypothetical protein M406DRAFT_69019 [Cryphonectria parasitica EP155]